MKNWETILVVLLDWHIEFGSGGLSAGEIVERVRERGWNNIRGLTPENTVTRDLRESPAAECVIRDHVSGTRKIFWRIYDQHRAEQLVAGIEIRYPVVFRRLTPPLDTNESIENKPERIDGAEQDFDEADEIERINQSIIARQGQGPFRSALMRAYRGKCAVTGWTGEPALEAAHIRPYSGASSSVVSNGLLLRSDIHTLFDLGLILIHPETLRIAVAPNLHGTDYQQYHGKELATPEVAKDQPDRNCLRHRQAMFDSSQPDR